MSKETIQIQEIKKNLNMEMFASRQAGPKDGLLDIRITRIPEGWVYEFIFSKNLVFVPQETIKAPAGFDIPEMDTTVLDTKIKIVKMILKHYKKGATYKEIAAHLNKNKIPTFSGSGNWHSQTVHRIVKGKMTADSYGNKNELLKGK